MEWDIPSKPDTVTLTAGEVWLCEVVAQARASNASNRGWRQNATSAHSDRYQNDLMGCKAEAALCKRWNVYWEGYVTQLRDAAGEKIADMRLGLYEGALTVDAKAIRQPRATLPIKVTDPIQRAYCLAYPTGSDVVLIGYYHPEFQGLAETWRRQYENNTPVYAVPQGMLRSLNWVVTELWHGKPILTSRGDNP